jgi:hypothetical protein
MPNPRSTLTIAASAAVLACAPCGLASAQNAGETAQEAVPVVPPAMIAALPPDGCVWNSAVFSAGAIVIERMDQPVYFRCSGGSWVAFTSSSQAIDAQNKAGTGGAASPAAGSGNRR